MIRNLYDLFVRTTQHFDGLASLGLRLLLFPVLLAAGWEKLHGENWFADAQASFPWPFSVIDPTLSWALAEWTEFIGAILLLLGLGVRLIAGPLMVTMFVAAYSVHWANGWPAIAPSFPAPICMAGSLEAQTLGPIEGTIEKVTKCYNVNERTIAASKRLERAKSILEENGDIDWLSEYGSFVKLNNGIEFATIYFLMLFALLIIGGGRYFSLDYWLAHWLQPPNEPFLLSTSNRGR